jgi:hypothetical protein
MSNGQPPIKLDVPYFMHEPQRHLRSVKWCQEHWGELMFSLKDRGLGDQISPDAETLNAKFLRGEMDPCWEACNMVNIGALEIFGVNKVVGENGGCPVCAFANITQHVADLMAMKFMEPH